MAAKAAMLALVEIPYQRSWGDQLQRIQLSKKAKDAELRGLGSGGFGKLVSRRRSRSDVCFGGRDLALGRAEEHTDRKRYHATHKDEPGPGDFRPPLRHEPAEIPFGGHELSSEER